MEDCKGKGHYETSEKENNLLPVPEMEVNQNVRIKLKRDARGDNPSHKYITGEIIFKNQHYITIKNKTSKDTVLIKDFQTGRAELC